jgi:hypothetical protein
MAFGQGRAPLGPTAEAPDARRAPNLPSPKKEMQILRPKAGLRMTRGEDRRYSSAKGRGPTEQVRATDGVLVNRLFLGMKR